MEKKKFGILLACLFIGMLSAIAQTAIINPYADVDWNNFGQYKANLHTHTLSHRIDSDGKIIYPDGSRRDSDGNILREPQEGYSLGNRHPEFNESKGHRGGSDGTMTPDDKIKAYHQRGYKILALADHNMVTWPWEKYGIDSSELGMLAVQGAEPSRHHHMGSYFIPFGGKGQKTIEESLDKVTEMDGLAVIFHPGRYKETVDWYINLYENYHCLVGMEVYNQGDRYPGDRKLWDQVLTRLMPVRPVWGYSNDDAHEIEHVGRNWQTFILPELSEKALRNAMRKGHFYFSYAQFGHPEDGTSPAPLIQKISIDADKGTISIEASGHQKISWISGGREISSGKDVLDINEVQGYVRAELLGETGISYTQPFFVGDPEKGTPQGSD